MKVYLDASVLLGRTLREVERFDDWSPWDFIVSSELVRVEVWRTLDRLRLQGRLSERELAFQRNDAAGLMKAVHRMPVYPGVLARASEPFPTPIGTLDAIHLSTALLWIEDNSEPLTFLTHDRHLAEAAAACGLKVLTSQTSR